MNTEENEVRERVNTLHTYHLFHIREKFEKSLKRLDEEFIEIHNEFVSLKSRWTFHWQEILLRWELRYKDFVQHLIAWMDSFLFHQRAILILAQNVIPLESFQVLETIFRKTEKIKSHALRKLGQDKEKDKERNKREGKEKEKQKEEGKLLFQEHRAPAYIACLLKFLQYWKSIETRHADPLKKEIHTLSQKYNEIKTRLLKEQEIVNTYEKNVQYLEEENAQLCETILKHNLKQEVELRSAISIKQGIGKLKPKLLFHKNKLQHYLTEFEQIQERCRLAETILPDGVKLNELHQLEVDLLNKRQKIQTSSFYELETITIQSKQKEDCATKQFQYYMIRQIDLSFKERRSLEWQQWVIVENAIRDIEPWLDMLRKHISQHREDCITLFSLSEFESFLSHYDSSYLMFRKNYFHNRMALQIEHLQNLVRYLILMNQDLNKVNFNLPVTK